MTEKQLNQPCLATNDAKLFLIINFRIYAHCAADTLLETAKQSRDDFKDVNRLEDLSLNICFGMYYFYNKLKIFLSI